MGDGLTRASIHKEAKFRIDCTRIPNVKPKVFISNIFNEVENTLVAVNEDTRKNLYKCSYVGEKIGKYCN